MPKQPPGVMIYFDLLPTIALMPMEQRGELFTAILMYAGGYSESPELDGNSKTVWTFLKPRIDEDIAHYAEICEKRATNGRKGGLAKASNCQANASKTLQNVANPTQPNITQPNPKQIGGAPPPASVVKSVSSPSFDEVQRFIAEKCPHVNADKFFNHYEASGWKLPSGLPVEDWRKKALSWEAEDAKRPTTTAAPQPAKNWKMAANFEPNAADAKESFERLRKESAQ